MSSEEVIKLIGQGGIIAVLLAILGHVLKSGLERLIDEVKSLRKDVGELKDKVIGFDATFRAVHDLTPVEEQSIPTRRTPPRGVPSGYYGPSRPGTRGE